MPVRASALTRIPPPKGAATHARLRSMLCQKQHSPTLYPGESFTRHYFFPDWLCRLQQAPRQQVMPDDHSESAPPLPIPNRTVKRLHADDSADYPCESRSSSGSPAATETPPRNGGVSAFTALCTRLSTRLSKCTTAQLHGEHRPYRPIARQSLPIRSAFAYPVSSR
jgi:hypothetical protein